MTNALDATLDMNTYCLITPDGQSYGPIDENGLAQWVRERRVDAASQIRCVETGVVSKAGALPFLAAVLSPPPAAGVARVSTGHQLTEFPVVAVVLLHFATCGLFNFIWFSLMHGKMPQVRHDDPSAGKAIGFMCIPFFNLYWIFFSNLRLCERLEEQRQLHGLPPSGLRGLALARCIVRIVPYVNILGILIMDPIYFGLLQSKVNELAALNPGGQLARRA